VVAYEDEHLRADPFDLHRDRLSRAVLHGVGHEVRRDLLDAQRIEPRERGRELEVERRSMARGVVALSLDDFGHDRSDVDELGAERQPPRAGERHVEEVVDQPVQAVHHRRRTLQRRAHCRLVGERASRLVQQEAERRRRRA